ncbi:Hsp33 family molecular chaperone HslO [Shigella flexneri]
MPEDDLLRSEQLPTRLFIRTGEMDGQPAAVVCCWRLCQRRMRGMISASGDTDGHRQSGRSYSALSATDVLWRFYHEEEVTVYDPEAVEFKCTCSRERCADALKTLPDEGINSILAESGEIDMHCDYCGTHYVLNSMDMAGDRNNASRRNPQVH